MIELAVLGSGSSGNSIVVRAEGQVLLVDAGFSGVELQRRLDAVGVDSSTVVGILISHEHDDHVQAARVFAKRQGGIPGYANSLTAERLVLAKRAPENMVVFANGMPFVVGPFQVEAFSVCHDAVDPVGFIIRWQDRKIGIATDVGHPGKMVPLKLRDSHILVLESNHDPEMLRESNRPARLQHRIRGRRGHLSNEGALALVRDVTGPATQHVFLAHLSDDCNDRGMVRRKFVANLQEIDRDDVNVVIADQDRPSEFVAV